MYSEDDLDNPALFLFSMTLLGESAVPEGKSSW
jgi:hypothetical protein